MRVIDSTPIKVAGAGPKAGNARPAAPAPINARVARFMMPTL